MSRLIYLLLTGIFLWLHFFIAAAQATERNARILTGSDLEAIYQEIVFAETTLPRHQLRIIDFTARPATLTLPAGAFGYRTVDSSPADRPGRKILQVALLVAGKEYGTVRMAADLRLFDQLLCVTRDLGRHEILTPDDFKLVERDITMLGNGLVRDPEKAVGKRLTTSVRSGTILYDRHLEEPPLVNRGDLVTIMARSGPLEIKAPGKARSAGAKGELIRVKNLMSRQIIHAMVQEPGVVEVLF